MGSESKTCVNCHIMRDQYDGWQKASHHAAATCNDCHVPHGLIPKYLVKGENGFEHSKAFTLQDFHEPILIKPKSARIVQKNCIRCHGDLMARMDTTRSCIDCHRGLAHRRNGLPGARDTEDR